MDGAVVDCRGVGWLPIGLGGGGRRCSLLGHDARSQVLYAPTPILDHERCRVA